MVLNNPKMKIPQLKTNDYLLRAIHPDDSEQFYQLVQNNLDRLLDFFPGTVAGAKTIEETKSMIETRLAMAANSEYCPFVIVDQKSGQLCGYMDVKNFVRQIPKAELGTFIDRDHAGKGAGTAALKEIINWLFNEGFRKLLIRTHESNDAARRMAEKLGFRLEGTIRADHVTSSGEITDLLYLGLLKEEFNNIG